MRLDAKLRRQWSENRIGVSPGASVRVLRTRNHGVMSRVRRKLFYHLLTIPEMNQPVSHIVDGETVPRRRLRSDVTLKPPQSADADRTISSQSWRVNSRTTAPPGVSSSTTCAVGRSSFTNTSAARLREVYNSGSRLPSSVRSWKYRGRISGTISCPLSVRTLSFRQPGNWPPLRPNRYARRRPNVQTTTATVPAPTASAANTATSIANIVGTSVGTSAGRYVGFIP
jgi:hypothetical protein